jgi:plastocyanin domain-containing protein
MAPSVVGLEAGDYIQDMRACHPAATFALLGLGLLVATSACKKSDASTGPSADVTAGEHGFTPTSFDVPAGGPGSHATVTFVRTTDKTCATEVVFPDLNIKKDLPLNQVVGVDLPTDTAKRLSFECGMAMYKGAVVVRAR